MKYWLNGEECGRLNLDDRAIHYGDGFFTTCAVKNREIHLITAHWNRLIHHAERLHFAHVDWNKLKQEILKIASYIKEGVLKIIITRGAGQRGYLPDVTQTATRIVLTSAQPYHYHRWKHDGIKLSLSQLSLARQPLLAGLKHLNRLEQVLIRQELAQTDADEIIVLDTEGYVIECCAANIFWRKGNQVFTPKLNYAGVNGVMRQHIIQLLPQLNYSFYKVSQPIDELLSADEIVICNALMPVVPVKQAVNNCYYSRELFRKLMCYF